MGINKIRQSLKQSGLKDVKIEENCGGTMLTIFRSDTVNDIVNDTVNAIVNDTVNDTVNDIVNLSELSKRQKDICSLIQTNTNITTAQMAASLKISVSTLRRELSELQKAEIVKRVGSDKKGHWIIANNENQIVVLAK